MLSLTAPAGSRGMKMTMPAIAMTMARTVSRIRRCRASLGLGAVGFGRQSRRALSIPMAMAGAPMIAATGPLRRASRVMAIPMKLRRLGHQGTRQRLKIAVAAMNTRSGMCAGSWKSGDCHSVMFSRPQSPPSTYRRG